MFVCLFISRLNHIFLFVLRSKSTLKMTVSVHRHVCTLNRGTPLFLFQIAATLVLGAWLVEVSS